MIDLVHITNNLPLALGPINIVSNTHGPNMTLILSLWKRLSQWIVTLSFVGTLHIFMSPLSMISQMR